MSRAVVDLSDEDIALLKESSLLVGKTLAEVAKRIAPGVTTGELDRLAEEFIRDNGAVPGFKGLYGCPSTLLISVNEEVVHGLPGHRELRDGDIASVDCGVLMNGLYGDSAYTFAIGEVGEEVRACCASPRSAWSVASPPPWRATARATSGSRYSNTPRPMATVWCASWWGMDWAASCTRHPKCPTTGGGGMGVKLRTGMVLAIEPMINMGVKEVRQMADGWTIATRDGKPSAHFEHDVAVRRDKAEVLSTFSYITDVLKSKGEYVA
jgi:methionyl aminopeptidase